MTEKELISMNEDLRNITEAIRIAVDTLNSNSKTCNLCRNKSDIALCTKCYNESRFEPCGHATLSGIVSNCLMRVTVSKV